MGYIQHKSEESVEDYLETILVLSKRLPVVRSIDIANELEYSKPSVSVAMKNLRGKGYITVSPEAPYPRIVFGSSSCFSKSFLPVS